MIERNIPLFQVPPEIPIPVDSEGLESLIEVDSELEIIRGVDGISPRATVEQTAQGAVISITDLNGTTTANVLNGKDGEQGIPGNPGPRGADGQPGPAGKDGADGKDGKDGKAATIEVESTLTGDPGTNAVVSNVGTSSQARLRFTIPRGATGDTGATGAPGKDGVNGKDGKDGTNGQDGFSPTATVSKSGSTATISITDKNGTTTASVSDGINGTNGTNGTNGQDGYSPTATVVKTGDTATITITDKNGTTTASVKDGSDASQVNSDWDAISGVAQILNKPTIPTVNNATLTIQKNSTNVATFTANASSNVTADISVPTKTSDLVNDGADNTSTYLEADETAYRASGIPYGAVDNASTSTAFTATVPGITSLYDGVCMWLKNGVVTSAAGFTININGLGAKPVYSNMSAATAESTLFNVNYTMMFVYDSTRVAGGCWMLNRGYYTDTNSIAYQVRTNSTALTTTDRTRYYRLLFTSADGTQWVPANTQYDNSATSNKTVNQKKINPFGRIVYMTGTTNVPAGSAVGASVVWDQYTLALGYSFAKGSALTMTFPKPVYLKCAPQTDGSAIIDSTTPWVQDLPTTEDGKIYIFLGMAYSATNIELHLDHPIYYYKDGQIRLFTNAPVSSAPEAFYINATSADFANHTFTSDKTFDQIKQAVDNGKKVVIIAVDSLNNTYELPLTTVYDDETEEIGYYFERSLSSGAPSSGNTVGTVSGHELIFSVSRYGSSPGDYEYEFYCSNDSLSLTISSSMASRPNSSNVILNGQCVYDAIGNVESILQTLNNGGGAQ